MYRVLKHTRWKLLLHAAMKLLELLLAAANIQYACELSITNTEQEGELCCYVTVRKITIYNTHSPAILVRFKQCWR